MLLAIGMLLVIIKCTKSIKNVGFQIPNPSILFPSDSTPSFDLQAAGDTIKQLLQGGIMA